MGSCGRPFASPDSSSGKPSQKPTSQGCCFGLKGQASLSAPEEKDPPGKMRAPLLLLLALLALLATVARAEEDQETLRTRFQGLVQKAQERIATFQESAVYQQMRELAEAGIERVKNVAEQVKTRVSSLLERNSA